MTRSNLERAAEFIGSTMIAPGASDPRAGVHLLEQLRLRERRRKRRMATAGAMLAGVALGTFVAVQPNWGQKITYRIGGAGENASVGSYVSAPLDKSISLQFSEGSHVVFEPNARGRVTQTTRHGAMMVIEEGHARADIVHQKQTDWRVYAGPYVVSITGTSFDVGYEMSTQTFELNMRSGSVRVAGPGLANPIEVNSSQHIVLSVPNADAASGRTRAPTGAAKPTPDTAPGPPGTCDPVAGARMLDFKLPESQERSPASGATPNHPVTWSQLASTGQYHRIMELAEQQGPDKVLASASNADLMAFGNAARFEGRWHSAKRAYLAVRDRFAGTSSAISAAYFLGRVSESTDPSAAITWYDRYVAEAPAGAWVAEATGRRMAILYKTQGAAAANRAAKDYLQKYPEGPYAGFARKILGL